MINDRPLNILIVNAHSQSNAGDHAIVLGQLQLLKKIVPAARLAITSRTPKLDRPLLASRGVKVIAPIFHSPSGAAGKWRPWAKALLSLFFPLPALVFMRYVSQADLVMACGGGYFYSTRSIPGLTFWQNYLHLRLAILFNKEIIFFPQSYGPLDNPLSRRLLAGLLASRFVRVVCAREEISLAVLRGILPARTDVHKLQSCPDMAFNFSPEFEHFTPTVDLSKLTRPCLALALRDWDFPGQKTRHGKRQKRETYIQAVITSCQALHEKYGFSFVIFSQAQGPSFAEDDRRISRYVYDRLLKSIPHSHLHFFKTHVGASPAAFIYLLLQADMLVTSRMHAAIFAFLAGIPAVVIGYQHKSPGILQALGLESCSLPIDEIGKEMLLSRCEDVWQNREEWKKIIVAAVYDARETIEAKFRLFFKGSGST
jgi:colanic acid/amylovoran biosynthesis protein